MQCLPLFQWDILTLIVLSFFVSMSLCLSVFLVVLCFPYTFFLHIQKLLYDISINLTNFPILFKRCLHRTPYACDLKEQNCSPQRCRVTKKRLLSAYLMSKRQNGSENSHSTVKVLLRYIACMRTSATRRRHPLKTSDAAACSLHYRYSGVLRGCGGVRRPRASSLGDPTTQFSLKSVGKCLKMQKNKRKERL